MNKIFGAQSKLDDDLNTIGYSVSTEIGTGTYGKVYEGVRERTLAGDLSVSKGTLVAVKVIDRTTASATFLKKFLPRELEVVKQVDHKNIIKTFLVYDVGSDIYIITELARTDLLDYIRFHGALRETLCRRLFYDLASGVEYMHSNNLVHRDIKCENCLIGYNGILKLGDFGFARSMEQDSLSSTFCGSTVYAAPEILIAGGAYDPRWVDSWSCGIVLYAMLTAKMPFSRNVLTKFVKYRYVEAPPIPTHITDMAISVIRGILLFNPDERLKLTVIAKKKHEWYSVNALNIIKKKTESNNQIIVEHNLSDEQK